MPPSYSASNSRPAAAAGLKDTVNAALQEIADRSRRAAAVGRMRHMVANGEIDFCVIEESAEGVDGRPASTGDAEHHAV